MPRSKQVKLDMQAIRNAYGFTHREFAQMLGCREGTIWKMIDNPRPPREVYQRVLCALEEGMDWEIDTLAAAAPAKREMMRKDGNGLKAQMWLLAEVLKGIRRKQGRLPAPKKEIKPLADTDEEDPPSIREIAAQLVAESTQAAE